LSRQSDMLLPRGALLIACATIASITLVAAYLAAGGAGYEPTPVADPCASRAWTAPHSLEEDAQQFLLSALDGAACELGVSREELAAALPSEESRQKFAAEHGIDDAELQDAIRAGVTRAINDAEDAGVINPLVAEGLRTIVSNLPIDQAVDLINGAQDVFGDASGTLDRLGGILGGAGDALGGLLGQ
jgi:AcrR family transcriptional regulator